MKAIICEYHPWESIYRIGNHHYAREMRSDGWDVLWLSHPVSFFHGLKKENKRRMEIASSGGFRHKDGPLEIIPRTKIPYLNKPFLRSMWVLENSLRNCSPDLKYILSTAGFGEPDLLWITDTSMYKIADMVGYRKVAVRIADDNTKFAGMPSTLRIAEDEICERADFIFVTSGPLYDTHRQKYGEKVSILRNGVEYEHFQGNYKQPDEYTDLRGNIAVYVGAIEEWFEIDWVKKLAESGDDLDIVIIGRSGIDLSELRNYGHVHLLGPKPYAEIPAYLSHASVGIIPFRRTPLVESVSPIKMFEYFASGLPVVSTSWRELESLGSPAVLVKNGDEFVNAVRDKMNIGDDAREKMRDYGRLNSWRSRHKEAMQRIGLCGLEV